MKTSGAVLSGGDTGGQLQSDCDTLCDISDGLDRLEALLDATPVISAALARGYFAPDEDDRLRQALLAYRNYRLAAYEIIFRHYKAAEEPNGSECLKGFLLAFAAALVLSEKSLRIIEVAEHQPMLRAKINEPDSKFEFPSGFFEDVVLGYSSTRNFRALARADRNWRALRHSSSVRSVDGDRGWSRLVELIRRKRKVVRRRLVSVVARRIRHGWRSFLKTALKPAKATRSGLQAMVGRGLAGAYVVPNPVHVLTPEVIESLRPRLQPGDVLLCRAEGKLTAALMPGFWSHTAIYLGSRAGLELLGVQNHAHRRGDIHFPLIKRLGRFTLAGDDIVNLALDGLEQTGACLSAALQPAGLILKRRDGRPHEVAEDRIVPLLQRIRRGWRPARSFKRQPA